MRTYQTEFPDFGQLDVQLPPGFKDVSWHHESMPSFAKVLESGAYLWVAIDYADLSLREIPALDRFNALLYASEHESEIRSHHSTDDWDAMVHWISEQH